MSSSDQIVDHLRVVAAEREARHAEPGLNEKVLAIKRYQQLRFRHTYADLLESTRYGPAAHFFLEELYGPSDFSRRDAQFARVVPTMVRLFSTEIVKTVAALAELHSLSERLDTLMGRSLRQTSLDAAGYAETWRAAGSPLERTLQIDKTIGVARSLESLTRKTLLRNSLRLMRSPARAAGLGELQKVLEQGFEAFRAMNGASEFIALVETREQHLAAALFGSRPSDAGAACPQDDLLRLLP